jgi:ATP-dependent Clp protease adaptor protein ClpS
MGENKERDAEGESGVATLPKPRIKEPPLYQVLLLNDDYTTMDFVVLVLQKFFHKTPGEANKVMLKIHHEGRGPCGLYSYDVAETKVMQVNDFARKNEMPLKCVMEKE